MADIQKLKALAELIPADNNIWNFAEEHESPNYQGYMVVDGWRCHVASTGMGNSDGMVAEFIAAANPAAVLKLIAEIERLQNFEVAYKEFSDKTDWVQETAHWSELGMHRADVLRKRVDQIKTENTDLHATLQAAKGEIERLNAGALEDLRLRTELMEQFNELKAENEALRECVEDLALSLECEVNARYAGPQSHPALKRKYDGDMQEVIDARALLSKEASQ